MHATPNKLLLVCLCPPSIRVCRVCLIKQRTEEKEEEERTRSVSHLPTNGSGKNSMLSKHDFIHDPRICCLLTENSLELWIVSKLQLTTSDLEERPNPVWEQLDRD
jgi:hypothetical protein